MLRGRAMGWLSTGEEPVWGLSGGAGGCVSVMACWQTDLRVQRWRATALESDGVGERGATDDKRREAFSSPGYFALAVSVASS